MKSRLFGALAALVLLFAPAVAFAQVAKPDIVEIVSLNGEIDEGTATQIKDQVAHINANPSAKSVLLVLNTPGGGVSASATIQGELSKLKVPVVAFCETECASGGVYSMTARSVKFIAVREDTIGGSVGVIMHMTRYGRLLQWAKIDSDTFKSGIYKDSGNPSRDMTPQDREYLQGIVDDLAGRFYHLVGEARPKITAVQWAQIKTARIFIGPAIVKAGLADAVMTREQALAKAKELSGSKLIFTRDELKSMSHAADESNTGYRAPALEFDVRTDELLGDLHMLAQTAREVNSGLSVSFEYRLPYNF